MRRAALGVGYIYILGFVDSDEETGILRAVALNVELTEKVII